MPARAQEILVLLQLLAESVPVMDCVASTMIAILKGPADAPFMAAVDLAVIVTELLPKIRRKYSGTVACCATCTAFEAEGP
jgi:hypothetical protein